MSIKTKVARDSVRTFLTGEFAGVFQVLTGIIIANTLGPAGKGIYSGVQLLYSGLQAIVGGVGSAITYFLTKGKRPLHALLPTLLRLFAILCLIVWIALYTWGKFHGFSLSLKVFISVVPACILVSWKPSVFISYDGIRYLNIQNIIFTIVTFLGTALTLLYLRTSVSGPLIAWVVGIYYLALAGILFMVPILRTQVPTAAPARASEILSFSARASLTNFMSFLNSRIDSILVLSLAGVVAFGIYSMATGVAELLYSFSQAFATAMARSIGVNEFERSAFITAKAIRLSTIVVTGVSIVVFMLAPIIIDKVYGKQFDPAALPLRILLPGLIVFSSSRIFNSFFSYQLGRPIFAVYLMAAVTVIQALGCALLIPRFGLAGAATASTLAYVLATLGQAQYFCKLTGVAQQTLWLPTRSDFAQIWDVIHLTRKDQGPRARDKAESRSE